MPIQIYLSIRNMFQAQKPAEQDKPKNIAVKRVVVSTKEPTAKESEQTHEYYEVMYTRHMTQRQKIWSEGLFTFELKTGKAQLYEEAEVNDCTAVIDCKYIRIKPDFKVGEQFKLNKFLLEIVERRDEGKKGGRSAVKSEKKQERKIQQSQIGQPESSKAKFTPGEKTGSATKKPMRNLVSQKTAAPAFPIKGRKKFKAPLAKRDSDSDGVNFDPLQQQQKEDAMKPEYSYKNRENDIRAMMFGDQPEQPTEEPEKEDSDMHIMRVLAERRRKVQYLKDENQQEFGSESSASPKKNKQINPLIEQTQIVKPKADAPQVELVIAAEICAPTSKKFDFGPTLSQQQVTKNATAKFNFGGVNNFDTIQFKKDPQASHQAAIMSNPKQGKSKQKAAPQDQFLQSLSKQYSKPKQTMAPLVRKQFDPSDNFGSDLEDMNKSSQDEEIEENQPKPKIAKQAKIALNNDRNLIEKLKQVISKKFEHDEKQTSGQQPEQETLSHKSSSIILVQPLEQKALLPSINLIAGGAGSILNQKLNIQLPTPNQVNNPIVPKQEDQAFETNLDENFISDFVKKKKEKAPEQSQLPSETTKPKAKKKPVTPDKKGALFNIKNCSQVTSEYHSSAEDQPQTSIQAEEESEAKTQGKEVKPILKPEQPSVNLLNSTDKQDITSMIKSAASIQNMQFRKEGLNEEERKALLEFTNRIKPDQAKQDEAALDDPMTHQSDEGEEITEEMILKVKKEQIIEEKRKRKLEEIERKKKEKEIEPDDYENYGKNKLESKDVKNQISKINALDKLKEDHFRQVTDHNIKIKKFEEVCLDWSIRHQIYDMPREFVFRNRKAYAAYFVLAVIEMLKYAVKEDYESSRTEINLIPISLEFIKPEKKSKALPKTMKSSSKKKKKIDHLKQKQLNQKYEDSSEDSEDFKKEEDEQAPEDLFEDEAGSYYLKFKEGIPAVVKKDMMLDDLWLLLKRPLVTNQSLADVTDMVMGKSAWHHNGNQSRMKIKIIGKTDDLKFQAPQYKYAFKSVNLQGYETLIENLIEFRQLKNPYVDSILNVANSKSKFKIIKEMDPEVVEKTRQDICSAFKLNIDQEIVLNEVTKWFLPIKVENQAQKAENTKSNDHSLIEGLSEDTEDEKPKPDVDLSTFNHHNTNIILVHGAFGCGKSYLLVSIIRYICHLLEQENETETKILVCALTNVAVDRILLTLREQGFEDFGRVGSLKKIHKALMPYTFSASTNKKSGDKEALRHLEELKHEIEFKYMVRGQNMPHNVFEEYQNIIQSMEEIKNSKMQSRIQKLTNKRVIGATCASTGFEVMKNMQFKIVILDECSQMLEPQSLLPISKFNCRKLLAVGDPLQLPPIISFNFKEKRLQQQQILEAQKHKGCSKRMQPHLPLFVRLQTEGQPSIILRTQYRCHPVIANVANYLFYEGTLRNGVDEDSRKRLLKQFQPYTFISAERGEEQKKDFSFINKYEAHFIMAILDYLCQLIYRKITGSDIMYKSDEDGEGNEEASAHEDVEDESQRPDYSIGVILTYKAQVDYLKKLIEDMNNELFKQIQVSTVDAFQGAERDIIILGCVRTKNLGFTEDCRRLNVAITRARRHLIVVGKESLLRRNNNWRYIIEKSKSEKDKDRNYGYKTVAHFIRKGGNFKSMMKEFN